MDGLNDFWDQVWCRNFYKGQVFKCLFCHLNAKECCETLYHYVLKDYQKLPISLFYPSL